MLRTESSEPRIVHTPYDRWWGQKVGITHGGQISGFMAAGGMGMKFLGTPKANQNIKENRNETRNKTGVGHFPKCLKY